MCPTPSGEQIRGNAQAWNSRNAYAHSSKRDESAILEQIELNRRMPRRPLVDLSALREMYFAAVIVAMVSPLEACETEEKVEGMEVTRSAIENYLEKNL